MKMAFAGMMRSDDQRSIRLCDLFAHRMDSLGPTPAEALLMVSYQGKRNQTGHQQYSGALPHVDAELCPVLAIAMWLFCATCVARLPEHDLCVLESW